MDEGQRMRVGVIGLGAMGMGVAQSLLRAGFEVHACDLRAEAVAAIVAAGGHAAPSPSDLGAKVDVAIVLVVNADQTEAVLFGEQGAVASLSPGSVVIASATVSPEYARALGKRLEERGLLPIDGPVSGGAAKAASGEMTMMASGSPAGVRQVRSGAEGDRGQGLPAGRCPRRRLGGQDGQPAARRRAHRRRRRRRWRSRSARGPIPTRPSR